MPSEDVNVNMQLAEYQKAAVVTGAHVFGETEEFLLVCQRTLHQELEQFVSRRCRCCCWFGSESISPPLSRKVDFSSQVGQLSRAIELPA